MPLPHWPCMMPPLTGPWSIVEAQWEHNAPVFKVRCGRNWDDKDAVQLLQVDSTTSLQTSQVGGNILLVVEPPADVLIKIALQNEQSSGSSLVGP